jgi:hypothetical protein
MIALLLVAIALLGAPAADGSSGSDSPTQPAAGAHSPRAVASPAAVASALVGPARARVKQAAGALKGALMAAMQSGGPVAAVTACHEQAPGLHTAAGGDGWTVGRTSLKHRNPKNVADPRARAVLTRWDAAVAAGTDPATLEHHEVIEQDGRRTFRYMKAIPTAPLCVTCHGEAIPAPVAERIRALYPADAAIGFRAGQIRGAFVVEKSL